MSDTAQQKSAALAVVTETLVAEKPVILHDAHDSGDHYLLLRGLTQATFNKAPDTDAEAEALEDDVLKYMVSIKTLIPFLHQNGLMGDFEFDTITVDNKAVTAICMPGGQKAVDAVDALYREHGQVNPFSLLTTGADKGMLDIILTEQGLDSKGRAAKSVA